MRFEGVSLDRRVPVFILEKKRKSATEKTDRQTGGKAGRQAGMQIGRQTGRQAGI